MFVYQQPDSIHSSSAEATIATTAEELNIDQHPFETLQQLPANATPAQADSALQSLYTHRPQIMPVDSMVFNDDETLATHNANNIDSIPLYYRQTFFSRDSLLNTNLYGRMGVAGDPIPYTLRSDSVLAPFIILLCLIVIYCTKRAAKFFHFHLRNFFRIVRTDSAALKEAASDVRSLILIAFCGACILSLVFFFYAQDYIGETYITNSTYSLLGIFLATVCGWLVCEFGLESFVNALFFTKQQNEQWATAKILCYTVSTLLLMPLLLFMVYFGLEMNVVYFYTLSVLTIAKIMAFYKAFRIFFNKKSSFLQFFLYLCTLEIIPTLIAWGFMLFTANYLKVN